MIGFLSKEKCYTYTTNIIMNMLRDFIVSFLVGNLEIYCYNSNGGNAFLRGSLEKEYDVFRCIHYNVAEGEIREPSMCVCTCAFV